jgi:hypothetical protein
MTAEPTFDALVAMTPIVLGTDIVRLAARHLFLGQVKCQAPVHDVFFPTSPKRPGVDCGRFGEVATMLDEITWFDFSRYSILYVAQAICRLCDPYSIYSMLDEDIVNEQLRSVHESSDWKKIGFALYTALFCDLVKDEVTKVPFKVYLEKNSRVWAKKLCERTRDQQWVQSQFTRQDTNPVELNCRDINIFFIKLHLLDPTSVLPAYNSMSKALPDLIFDLATTNYLGEPLQWTLIREDVLAAINTPSYPSNSSWMLTTDSIEHYFGIKVCEFILVDCHELGLWTGHYPDNQRISHFRERCLVM